MSRYDSIMKWVLFDYGEVLSLAQPAADRARLAEAAGGDDGSFWERYWEHRQEFDRATLSPFDYWSKVLLREPAEEELRRLIRIDTESWLHPNDEAVALMEELSAAGHPVALLSNMPVCIAEAMDRLPWIRAMNARFYSGRMGLAKPDPRIYRGVAEELGARPADLVFIDDRPVNVAAAAGVGLTAVHFQGVDRLRAELAAVLTF